MPAAFLIIPISIRCKITFYFTSKGQIFFLSFNLGTYGASKNLATADECTTCPPGKYCAEEGLDTWSGDCEGGFYCIGNATHKSPNDGITGIICPKGKQ